MPSSHIKFNAQDGNEQTIHKLNRLVDELTTRLATAELRLTQGFQLLKNPTAGYALVCDADGKGSWGEVATEETTPGGSDTQVQFNDGGEFGGEAAFVWNKATDTLTLEGDIVCEDIDMSGTLDVDGQVTAAGDVVFTGSGASFIIQAGRHLIVKPGTAPVTSTSTGTQGTVVFDATYLFYCYATNLWKRKDWDTF